MIFWEVCVTKVVKAGAELHEGFGIIVKTHEKRPSYPELKKALKADGYGACVGDYYWSWKIVLDR